MNVKISLTIFTKTQSNQSDQNFFITLPSKLKTQPKILNFFPLLRTPGSPIPITLPSSLPKSLTLIQATFTRRTSGHHLVTFRAVNFTNLPPPSGNKNKHNASHCTPLCCSCLPQNEYCYLGR